MNATASTSIAGIAQGRIRAEIALWRHGWAWLLALALTVCMIATFALWLLPAGREREIALAELAQEQAIANGPKAAKAATLSDEQKLQAVQAVLRNSPDNAQLVRKMATLAQAEQIALAQSDYQLQAVASGITRLQIAQPVRASYPQLRRYVEAVVREVPNASLDQMLVRRENVAQGQVEARLKWSLWTWQPARKGTSP